VRREQPQTRPRRRGRCHETDGKIEGIKAD